MNKMLQNLKGFSLVELSIVILVMSVVISGTFIFVGDASFQAKLIDDEGRIELIDTKINEFFIKNGRLPCPASRTDAIGTANFGDETDCSNAAAPAGTTHPAGSSNNVRIGVIPVRALGLPDKFMFDAYNNRFTYGVHRLHAVSANSFDSTLMYSNLAENIQIEHIDMTSGTQTSNIHPYTQNDGVVYVVVGHGPNANGATTYSGTLRACNTFRDTPNCALGVDFVDVPKFPDQYDDNVRWNTKQKLIYAKLKEEKQLGRNKATQGKLGVFTYYIIADTPSLPSIAGSNKMPFNTTQVNNLSDATLDDANDHVILGPGHYIMRAYTTSCAVQSSQVRIESSVTTKRIVGLATYADTTNSDCATNYAVGYMQLDQTENIAVYQYGLIANATDGLGRNTPSFGYGKNFVILEIWEL